MLDEGIGVEEAADRGHQNSDAQAVVPSPKSGHLATVHRSDARFKSTSTVGGLPARRPAALLAGRRLADNPQARFRAIGGLVLALFVTSVSVGVITTLVASAGPSSGTAAANTLVNDFWRDSAGQLVSSVPSVPPSTISNLSAIDGVTGVTHVHQVPSARPDQSAPEGLVLCAQLIHTPAIG